MRRSPAAIKPNRPAPSRQRRRRACPLRTHRRLASGLILVLAMLVVGPSPQALVQPIEAPEPATAHAPTDGDDLEQALESILQRAPFQQWKRRVERQALELNWSDAGWAQGLGDWLRGWMEAIGDWFSGLRNALSGMRGPQITGPNFGAGFGDLMLATLRVIAWVALALALIGAVYWLYLTSPRIRRTARRGQTLSTQAVRQAIEKGEALALDSSDWLDQASLLAQSGQTRLVYRTLYLGLLSGLHRRGMIDFRPHRTNWTYVARFAGPADDRERFSRLTHRFDEVWYGLGTVGEGDVGRAELDRLTREVGRLVGERADG